MANLWAKMMTTKPTNRIFLCTLLLLLMDLAKLQVINRLPCQASSSGTLVVTSTTQKPVRARTGGGRATHCCGGRPFNSEASMCCLGRVLSQTHRKCCLDGTNVPIASRCSCYPTSQWTMNQIDRLSSLEADLTGLIEELHDRESLAQREVTAKQEVIATLDARASQLFQSFLNQLGIDRNQAPREIDDIIQTIRFLNSNEQDMGAARKNALNLEEGAQRVLNNALDNTGHEDNSTAPEIAPESLRRIRREIERLRLAAEQAEEISNQANEELESRLPINNNKRLREIILERDRVLQNVTQENRLLRSLRDQLLIIRRLKRIVEADRDLLINLRQMLDLVLDEVINMEEARREEFPELVEEEALKRRRREEDVATKPTGSSIFRTSAASSRRRDLFLHQTRQCDFTPWEEYINTFDSRRRLVLIDLDDLLSAVGQSETTPLLIVPRSTRTERSFFAPRLGLSPPLSRPGVHFRERRDVTLDLYERVKHLTMEYRVEEAKQFRENAFAWLKEVTGSINRGKTFMDKILPHLAKTKPH